MPDMSSPIPLIILDVQDAIDQPIWNGKSHPGYLSVIQRLLQFWRSNGWPVLHVKHDEKRGSLEITRGKGFAVFHPTSGNVDASAVWAVEMS